MTQNDALNLAVNKLVIRFAPARSTEQLASLCIKSASTVAVCFDAHEDAVVLKIMSYKFVDPAQANLL